MFRIISKFLLFSVFILSVQIFAHEDHHLTDITGTNIDLKSYDHTVAGSVKDFTIWGSMGCVDPYTELVMKKDGQVIKTLFKKQNDGSYGGVITHVVNEKLVTTEVVLKSINMDKQQIILLLNGRELLVQLSIDGTDGHHMMNPHFSTLFNGEEVSFKMLDGEACFGLSSKIAMVVFGAYFHGTL